MNNKWQSLESGDIIDIIAPGYGIKEKEISLIADYVSSLGYIPRIPDDVIGDHIFCSNEDHVRSKHLIDALTAEDSKAVWCIKGGYGASIIINDLFTIKKPSLSKLFIGFSDNTAIHLFLSQNWGWPTLHAPVLWQLAKDKICSKSEEELISVISGITTKQTHELKQINNIETSVITSKITGGNMMLVQSSLGTKWHVDSKDKIIFLEEIDEKSYRVDRMLTHLKHAGIFEEAKAVIFGDFTGEEVKEQKENTLKVLNNFAESSDIPVYKISGIGHEKTNYPLPLNSKAIISGNTLTIDNK